MIVQWTLARHLRLSLDQRVEKHISRSFHSRGSVGFWQTALVEYCIWKLRLVNTGVHKKSSNFNLFVKIKRSYDTHSEAHIEGSPKDRSTTDTEVGCSKVHQRCISFGANSSAAGNEISVLVL